MNKATQRHGFLRKAGANIAWLFSGSAIQGGVALLVAAICARYLGPQAYGSLAFASTFVGMFAALTQFGLQRVLVRLLIRYPDNQGEILGSAIMLRLFGTILTCVVVICCLPYLPVSPLVHSLVLIFLIGLPLGCFLTLGAYFDASLSSRFRVWAQVSGVFVRAGLRLLMVFLGVTLIVFPWADVAGTVAASLLVSLIYAWKKGPRLGVSRSWLRKISRQSSPLIVVGLLYALQLRIDQIMLVAMLDERAVGIYAASSRLYELWLVIPGILATSVLPRIVKAYSQGADALQRDMATFYCILAWVAWPITLAMLILGPHVVLLIFGDQFAESVLPLQILICGVPLMFLHVGRTQWAITVKQQAWQAVMALIALVLKLAFNYLLIPLYGVAGAAAAMVLSLIGFSIVGPLFFSKLQRSQVVEMLKALCGVGWRQQAAGLIERLRFH